jgi:hypothetical protein
MKNNNICQENFTEDFNMISFDDFEPDCLDLNIEIMDCDGSDYDVYSISLKVNSKEIKIKDFELINEIMEALGGSFKSEVLKKYNKIVKEKCELIEELNAIDRYEDMQRLKAAGY